MTSILLDILRLMFWGPMRKLISYLSPAYSFSIAKAIAFFAYHILIGRRKIIASEIRASIGREWTSGKIDKTVFGSFNISIRSQLMMFYLPRLNYFNINEYVSIEGLGFLDDALSAKKGAIILNPHFGPFMLIMPALHYRGYRVNQIALQGEPPWKKRRGLDKKGYDIKYATIEGNIPVNFINTSAGPHTLRVAMSALSNNEILLYPSTGRGGTALHTVNLMKRKVALNIFPFKLALRTGASLLPAFVFCDGKMGKVIIERPLNAEGNFTPEKLTERYAEVLDNQVTNNPEHFLSYLYLTHKISLFGEPPFFIDQVVTEQNNI